MTFFETDTFQRPANYWLRRAERCKQSGDLIRAAVLEDMGYSVDIIEFVDFEHSPKNIMIRAKRNNKLSQKGREEAKQLCQKYGFSQKLLELCSEE